MVIVGMSGGLGNQMFQFALYEKLRHLGRDAYLDRSAFETGWSPCEFALDPFGISYRAAGKKDVYRLSERSFRPADKIRRRLFGAKKSYYTEDIPKGYQPEILSMENVYLEGYWQCEKYFLDIRDEILRDFSFPGAVSTAAKEWEKRIDGELAISVHVRRGDYLTPGNTRVYGGICTPAYYRKAMKWCRQKFDAPVFYIFTNDGPWCESNFFGPDIRVISQREERRDYEDMYLMTRCAHHIVANSSFSWWGAWLGQNPEKCVLAPERWFAHLPVSDAICDTWIRIAG